MVTIYLPMHFSFSFPFTQRGTWSVCRIELTTAEAAATKAPRNIPIGVITFPAAAAVGTMATVVDAQFDRMIPVYPGEFVAITAKNLGAVTTTGVVTFLVTYDYGWVL